LVSDILYWGTGRRKKLGFEADRENKEIFHSCL